MEGLVREMQDPETGVPVRSQKLFLTSIPSAFSGKLPPLLPNISSTRACLVEFATYELNRILK
jgi:hypothetical protein